MAIEDSRIGEDGEHHVRVRLDSPRDELAARVSRLEAALCAPLLDLSRKPIISCNGKGRYPTIFIPIVTPSGEKEYKRYFFEDFEGWKVFTPGEFAAPASGKPSPQSGQSDTMNR